MKGGASSQTRIFENFNVDGKPPFPEISNKIRSCNISSLTAVSGCVLFLQNGQIIRLHLQRD